MLVMNDDDDESRQQEGVEGTISAAPPTGFQMNPLKACAGNQLNLSLAALTMALL